MDNNSFDKRLKDVLQVEASQEIFCLQGLEERIMGEISGRLPKLSPWGMARQLVAPTRGVRLAQLAVLGTTAVVFLVLGVLLSPKVSSLQGPLHGPASATALAKRSNEVLFIMPAPGAHTVTVVGNFNGWEATPLSDEDGDGIWTASLPLSPGRYEYAFVVDGRWWGYDPLADEYVRSFGEYNSVRYVGQAGGGA